MDHGEEIIGKWHQIIERRDPSQIASLLADDVVFHSPVVHTPQSGRTITALYLNAAFTVLINDSFRYVREIVGPADAALEFTVEIDGISLNGVDMIKWNAEGKITEFKVMVRPLKAINLVHQKMAEMLERYRSLQAS